MKTKKVAMVDERFSAVGVGCWAIGGDWNNTTDQSSIAAVQRAVDLGINLFDVAPVYGFGHAEEVYGSYRSNNNLYFAEDYFNYTQKNLYIEVMY